MREPEYVMFLKKEPWMVDRNALLVFHFHFLLFKFSFGLFLGGTRPWLLCVCRLRVGMTADIGKTTPWGPEMATFYDPTTRAVEDERTKASHRS